MYLWVLCHEHTHMGLTILNIFYFLFKMIRTWLTKIIERKKITTKFTSWQGVRCFYVLRTGLSISSVVLGFAGWHSRWFRRCMLFVYNYIFSPHLTRCYGLLRTVLFKLYVFRPYLFSFLVYPSVLDDLPPLLRGKVHVDFSGSNIDDCFNDTEERSPKDDGWIVLVFSHVNNLQPSEMFDLPSGARCMSVLRAWFRTGADKWLRPLCWRQNPVS